MPRLLIGLFGKKGSGKTTVAKYLVKNYQFTELTFANPLKDAVKSLFRFTDAQLNDPELKEQVDPYWKVSPRQVLQIVGTELIRDTLPIHLPLLTQVFIRNILRTIDEMPEDARIVISDCRMPDEFQSLRKLNAFMIKITRSHENQRTVAHQNHSSETSLDNTHIFTPDIVFLNNQDLKNLYDQIDRYLNLILKK